MPGPDADRAHIKPIWARSRTTPGAAQRGLAAQLSFWNEFLVLTLCALLLAGCQFGSDSGQAEFVKDADAICADYERQIALVPQPLTFFRDFAVYMRRIVPIAREQTQKLRQVEAPESDAADYRRMLALLDQQLDLWAQAGEQAYAGNDQQAQATYEQSSAPGAEAQRISDQIGFNSCATPEG